MVTTNLGHKWEDGTQTEPHNLGEVWLESRPGRLDHELQNAKKLLQYFGKPAALRHHNCTKLVSVFLICSVVS
jgi:hypothetical protein